MSSDLAFNYHFPQGENICCTGYCFLSCECSNKIPVRHATWVVIRLNGHRTNYKCLQCGNLFLHTYDNVSGLYDYTCFREFKMNNQPSLRLQEHNLFGYRTFYESRKNNLKRQNSSNIFRRMDLYRNKNLNIYLNKYSNKYNNHDTIYTIL